MESILLATKKLLGISSDYTHFDTDIILHINSTFMVLNQLGVGPLEGFSIANDKAIWDDFLDGPQLEAVKTYMYLKVRLVFDPPTNSFLVEAVKDQIKELEWRLTVRAEGGVMYG